MLVSVVIPMYNSAKFIEETVNCVLNQTYKDLEIIVVDDHSEDNSYDLLKGIKDEKIKLFKNPKKGACAARNYGLEQSKGKYIQFLDADDLLSANKIQVQVEVLKHRDKNAVANCGWVRFEKEISGLTPINQAINKSYDTPVQWLIDSWTGNGMGVISGWLTTKELLIKSGKWNESLLINQDGEYFSRVVVNASEIIYCPEVCLYYRSGIKDSITKQKITSNFCHSLLKSFKLYEENTVKFHDNIEMRKALGGNYLRFIYAYDRTYSDLSSEAMNIFKILNVGRPWPIGSEVFKMLCKVFGFKNSLLIMKVKKLVSG